MKWISADLIGGSTPRMRNSVDVMVNMTTLYVDTPEALHELPRQQVELR
ncbi:hypothetical protein [Rhizobium giardinii]|uniref:Uncharacterized protein n=1 Tax=Rhizobium giardinii TaxID=56731 RepID=A0A7W8UA19_9HYPH|nr:hypothetical protein [Rhizobium giardinii]MBB5535604.1 hypothetical protein [Rhizobium giardinii]